MRMSGVREREKEKRVEIEGGTRRRERERNKEIKKTKNQRGGRINALVCPSSILTGKSIARMPGI